MKVSFDPTLTVEEACRVINDYQAALRETRPEVRWVFVEPDIARTASQLNPSAALRSNQSAAGA